MTHSPILTLISSVGLRPGFAWFLQNVSSAASVIVLASALFGSQLSAEEQRYEFSSRHMGTEFSVIIYHHDANVAAQAARAAFDTVEFWEQVLSDYRADSEVNRLTKQNDRTPNVPLPISSNLAKALDVALSQAKQTAGSFDPTVGPLTKLWRISRKTQEPTPEQELQKALSLVGYQHVALNTYTTPPTVTLAKPGMRFDFGGIGKGFAVDEAIQVMREQHGIKVVLMAAAGDITCVSAPPGKPGWEIDIAPLRRGEPARRLILKDRSVSTSGDLEQVAMIRGVRYSHVLNPKTGIGLTGKRSVTVVGPSGALVDSLTKAASVLPSNEVVKLLTNYRDTEFYSIVQEHEDHPAVVTESEGFRRYLQPRDKR